MDIIEVLIIIGLIYNLGCALYYFKKGRTIVALWAIATVVWVCVSLNWYYNYKNVYESYIKLLTQL